MYTTVTTLAALVASVLVSSAQGVAAQANPPPNATATRPAKTPPEQTSVPNTSPPATTTQTIGESNQKATVKKMNEDEKQKVETKDCLSVVEGIVLQKSFCVSEHKYFGL